MTIPKILVSPQKLIIIPFAPPHPTVSDPKRRKDMRREKILQSIGNQAQLGDIHHPHTSFPDPRDLPKPVTETMTSSPLTFLLAKTQGLALLGMESDTLFLQSSSEMLTKLHLPIGMISKL